MRLSTWILILSAVLLSAPPTLAQSLRFESEFVVMEIEADSLMITGHYVLSQEHPAAASLLYPYPRDKDFGGCRTLMADCRAAEGEWQAMETMTMSNERGILWNIPALEADTLEVRTIYRQARLTDFGLYIVTSMQSWDHPLRHAVFEIVLPMGAMDPVFSFPFEPCLDQEPDGRTRYRFEVEDFRPDKDIAVRWDQMSADSTNSQPQ